MVTNRRLLELALSQQAVDGILRGHKGARDAGRARAAIGLKHIAIDINAAFA